MNAIHQPTTESNRHYAAIAYALLANCLWGLMPIYFKGLRGVLPIEVLAHRIVWSAVILAALTVVCGRGEQVVACLFAPRNLAVLFLTALLLGIQWLAYIDAVAAGRVLQSSLGYLLAPVVNVLLGVLFLHERPRRTQWVAVGMALLGTLCLCSAIQGAPWIALTIATTFGAYALIRKRLAVDGVTGLLVETLLLVPPAVVVLARAQDAGTLGLGPKTATSLLLIGTGVITPVPLLAYVAAAQRMKLATLGVMQYVSPSIQFLLAILVFSEPLRGQLFGFALIWSAVSLYCLDPVYAAIAARRAKKPPLDVDQTRHTLRTATPTRPASAASSS
jgi:chloramphenicol-sensitive protein RarD